MEDVVVFSDTYLPTINGVSYTIATIRDYWKKQNARMDVVYPKSTEHVQQSDEHSVTSIGFPFYDGFRIGVPHIPKPLPDFDIVHVHTPFSLGIAGYRYGRQNDIPVIASYHTPVSEYTGYITQNHYLSGKLEPLCKRYERWFFNKTDRVLVPTKATAQYLEHTIGVRRPITVVPTGIDTSLFRPVDPSEFMELHDLRTSKPLIGYTGRHGHEKQLQTLIKVAKNLEVKLVFGGDGPARHSLEKLAEKLNVETKFLGFLPRESLPSFYSAIDVFAFPSPVETQGLVALEAIACGTPVVGPDSAALTETIDDNVTGIHYQNKEQEQFKNALVTAIGNLPELSNNCLHRRENLQISHTIRTLQTVYATT